MITLRNFFPLAGSLMLALFLNLTVLEKANAEPAPGLSSIAPGCALPGDPVSLKGHGFGARNVTVQVAGIAAQVLNATGNRVDFLVPGAAPPGLTQVTASNPGGQSAAIDFQVKHAEICANQFDDDCDALIDETDECPVTTLSITAPAEWSQETGVTGPFTIPVDFTSTSTSVPFTIRVSQTVDPPTGLTLSPPIDGETLHVTASTQTNYAQTLSGQETGSYTIRTTATVLESGQSQSVVTQVTVQPPRVTDEFSMNLEFVRRNDPVPLGDPAQGTVRYSFFPKDKSKSYTVRFEQSVTPNFGLELKPSLHGTIVSVPSGVLEVTDHHTQAIVTTQEGDYDLVTTATVVETGQTISAYTEVQVGPAGSPNLSISHLGMDYFAFPPDITMNLKAGMTIHGEDYDKVEGVTVKERRTGRQWLLTKDNDTGYSGKITIDTHGMVPDDCFTFYSTVHTAKGDGYSTDQKICVTGLPLEMAHISEEEIDDGFMTLRGTRVAKDVFTVSFNADVPETRMREIIAAYGGTIIGARPHDKDIQVRLVPAPDSLRALATLMHRMSQEPEVLGMDMIYLIDGLFSLQTSDPDALAQSHLKQIRAREAWYLARGEETTLAILDTGVDFTHPDVNAKLVRDRNGNLGHDFGDDLQSAQDRHSHGTHVAGIAAGMTDNGIGIAGIGWDTTILPVKKPTAIHEYFLKIPP